MRRIAFLLTLWVAGIANAGDWQDVADEAQARAVLSGRVLIYDNGARQEFRSSGKTLYNAGEDSWGNWRLQGAQYCSEWPPAGGWSCYDLQIKDSRIRFIGASGGVTTGVFAD